MGWRYGRVPAWLREGIAVWVAGQLEEKADPAIAHKLATHQDPASLMNGLETTPHTLDDYVEDALLFRYLEQTYGQQRVMMVLQAIVAGVPYKRVFERETGVSWQVLQTRVKAFSLDYIRARMPQNAEACLTVASLSLAST
jgi:hypothetical protein